MRVKIGNFVPFWKSGDAISLHVTPRELISKQNDTQITTPTKKTQSTHQSGFSLCPLCNLWLNLFPQFHPQRFGESRSIHLALSGAQQHFHHLRQVGGGLHRGVLLPHAVKLTLRPALRVAGYGRGIGLQICLQLADAAIQQQGKTLPQALLGKLAPGKRFGQVPQSGDIKPGNVPAGAAGGFQLGGEEMCQRSRLFCRYGKPLIQQVLHHLRAVEHIPHQFLIQSRILPAFLPLQRGDGQQGGYALAALAADDHRGQISIGIHAVGAGEDALEVGGAVRLVLAGLAGDAQGRVSAAVAYLLGGGDEVGFRAPGHDDSVVLAGTRQLAQGVAGFLREPVQVTVLVQQQVGALRQAGDNLEPSTDLPGEVASRPGRPAHDAAHTRQGDGGYFATGIQRSLQRLYVQRARPGAYVHVVGDLGEVGFAEVAALHFQLEVQQTLLPHRLIMREHRELADAGHAFDLHPGATGDAHVHVLTHTADAASHLAGGAQDAGDAPSQVHEIQGVLGGWLGDHLDEGDGEPVGAEDDIVTLVGHLAAGVFLYGKLDDVGFVPVYGRPAVYPHDGGALKAGGDGAIQILFASDVQFIHQAAVERQCDLYGVIQRGLVNHEGRRIIHLVGADGVMKKLVDDVLLGFLLHEGGSVILAHLGESGAHVADYMSIRGVIAVLGGAAAEELGGRIELLVYLQPCFEAPGGIIVMVVLGGVGQVIHPFPTSRIEIIA